MTNIIATIHTRSKQALFCDEMKKDLQKKLGSDCRKCGHRSKLEFAHVKRTKLSGKTGRGKKKRLYDIKNNLHCYILLCKPCHRQFDKDNKYEHPTYRKNGWKHIVRRYDGTHNYGGWR